MSSDNPENGVEVFDTGEQGGSESPPGEPIVTRRRGRPKKESGTPKLPDKEPWPGASEKFGSPLDMYQEPSNPEELVPAPGYKCYLALQNSGSGKYRQGNTYFLPDGQPLELFQLIGD